MMGSCHHLAVAMHRLTGWDLALVAGRYRGADAIFHVFCIDGEGKAWDARGRHAPSNLIDEQMEDGFEAWIVRLAGEHDVWRLARPEPGLLNPMHPTFVLDARDAAEEVLGAGVNLIGDGWNPRDLGLVDEASEGRSPVPDIGRAMALPVETTIAGMKR